MNFKTLAIASAMAVGMASSAMAATITFTSTGAFSNPSGGASVQSGGTFLDFPGSGTGGITAVPVNPAVSLVVPPTGTAMLGSLSWDNRGNSGSDFTANYTLTVTFTSPLNDIATKVFNLSISQDNHDADTINGLNPAALAGDINLGAGITASNLRWVETGDGSYSSSSSKWSVDCSRSCTSTLSLYADFSSTGNPNPIELPEPASMALLGLGLLGLGAVRRRKAA